MTKIILASDNLGKLVEIQSMFNSDTYTLLPQSEFNIQTPEETGLSFAENAILKARYAAQQSGLPAIADDSGLEIDALKGAPGIYSARYAGVHVNHDHNIQKVLLEMQEVPEPKRSARFRCVLVYLKHALDPSPIIAEGSWEGRILFEPQGEYGFGYDPIFFVPEYQCSAAELRPEIKNTISHRAQALSVLMSKLK